MRPRDIGSLATRLWARVTPTIDGCLEWQGYVRPHGYGQIGFGRKAIDTHRAAWLVTHGQIPTGMFVCHKCDNRICCNPQHLFLGTLQDNVADMVSKNRQARGLRLPQTKLADDQIRELKSMRQRGALQREIADHFGVTQGYVSEVLSGRYRRGVS